MTTTSDSTSNKTKSTPKNALKDSNKKETNSKTKTKDGNQSGSDKAVSEADKLKKFEGEGVIFKAKLIGSELVMEPRGDKMCQNSIQRLKAIIKGSNSHKRRIVLKISYDGVKVYDEKSNEMLHHHEVSQISYIASDDSDTRTFGYVSDVPGKAHQFICFKTNGPSISVMSVISGLFEAVLEKKAQAEREKQQGTSDTDAPKSDKKPAGTVDDPFDLIGDSGIADSSLISGTPEVGDTNKPEHSHWTSMLESSIVSPTTSFNSNINLSNSMSQAHNQANQSVGKQSVNNDMVFDDLFGGFSDPIIVAKNDSLISYKPESQATVNRLSQQHPSAFPISVPPSSHSANMGHYPMHRQQRNQQQQSSQQLGQHQFHNQQTPSQGQAMLPPPSSLPRPAPMMSAGQTHNSRLVYNRSAVSLSDAPLTRQSSFGGTSAHNNDNFVDRYAVFNDIDNLPSIFESTSLGSMNKMSSAAPVMPKNPISASVSAGVPHRSISTAENIMFRQKNPFDDDFFS